MPDLNRQFEEHSIKVPADQILSAHRAAGRLQGFVEGQRRGRQKGWQMGWKAHRELIGEVGPGVAMALIGCGFALGGMYPHVAMGAGLTVMAVGFVWMVIAIVLASRKD
jgi:hypothetical protein